MSRAPACASRTGNSFTVALNEASGSQDWKELVDLGMRCCSAKSKLQLMRIARNSRVA